MLLCAIIILLSMKDHITSYIYIPLVFISMKAFDRSISKHLTATNQYQYNRCVYQLPPIEQQVNRFRGQRII